MIDRVLLAALAAVIFLGAGGYTLRSLNGQDFLLAEASRDVCYSRRGVDLRSTPAVPEAIRRECTWRMRDYEANQIWYHLFAAAVGATAAFLVVGGIVIIRRQRRRQ